MNLIKLCVLSVLLFGLIGAKSVTGQTYYFSQSTETYNELQNATLISNNFNSGQFWNGDYGFSIDYFNRSYNFNGSDGLLISTDGYVACAEYTDSTDITINSLLAHIETRANNSGLYSKLEGQPGNRIVKLEWRNVGFSLGNSFDSISFQIWLYESQSQIEIRFGPNSVSSAAYGSFSGPSIGFYVFSLMQANVGQKLEGYFLTGDPENPNFSQYLGIGSLRLNNTPTNGTVYSFTTIITTGLEEQENTNTVFYPNPTESVVYSTNELISYKIFDLHGRLLKSEVFNGTTLINISDIDAGIYFLEVELITGEILRKKVFKQ